MLPNITFCFRRFIIIKEISILQYSRKSDHKLFLVLFYIDKLMWGVSAVFRNIEPIQIIFENMTERGGFFFTKKYIKALNA